MKTWLLSFIFFVLGPAMCVAQTGNAGAAKARLTPAQKAKATVEKMNAACALKPDQAEKVEGAYLEYYKKHDALKKQKNILSKDVYEQREEDMKKARNAVLKATLTAGQYKQWSAAKNKEKAAEKKDNEEE